MREKKVSVTSSFLLFMAAFIWGIAFVAQSVGMDYMGPWTFNGGRFILGGLVLLPVVLLKRRKNRREGIQPEDLKTTVIGGGCCGLALCTAAVFQQFGIMYTTVGKAGFITTLYIIIVPILGIFLKKKVPGKVWLGAMLAAIGMYLLCMSESLVPGKGDALVLICAILFSIHILIIDYFAPKADGVELSCIQFFVAGLITTIGAFLFEQPSASGIAAGIVPLAYAGILSCGAAYTFQIIGQKDTDPTIASLLLSLESVVSMLAGWVILGQALSRKELIGCGLVFGAVILVQLPEKNEKTNKLTIAGNNNL